MADLSESLVSFIVILSFVAFIGAAQIAHARAVATRGAAVTRLGGVAHWAAYFFPVPYVVVWLRPGPQIAVPDQLRWAGLLLSVGGVAFAIWAIATLGRHYALELEVHRGHEVVRRGPYAVVRHPIYLGLASHSLGACLATGNLVLTAGTLAVTLPILVLRALREERLLRDELGPSYDAYARDVGMLVPTPRPASGRVARPRRTPRS
ncbi:MAG TPA: isoprenylcysteine carboxylmethyltransferase family protein [Candidatus Limnocylindria bacterium]|nr:isoprenylcysteine carboxylmethyltransferase family protein [Candidatus Limnocylindria bacterium]